MSVTGQDVKGELDKATREARVERAVASRSGERRKALTQAAQDKSWKVVVPFRDPKTGNDRVHKNVRRGC